VQEVRAQGVFCNTVGRSSNFVTFVGRLNIPSGTLRTFAGFGKGGWMDGESITVVSVAIVFWSSVWELGDIAGKH